MPSQAENWPISRLIPYARNARTHSDAQVQQIAASMREFGWTVPMLVAEDGTIIAGHGWLQAALSLGLDTAPVIVAKGWSEAQRRAYTLVDNKLALNAGWDEDILALELEDLKTFAFDLTLTGFKDGEIERMLSQRTSGLTDPDAVPETPKEPRGKLGDLWLCGVHRILCGDATKADDVARVLGEVKPHLMVTDPPYGVEYDPDWRNRATRHSDFRGRETIGAGAIGTVSNDDQCDWREAWVLFPGEVAYVWHSGLHSSEVAESLQEAGFALRAQIIWAKNNIAISRGHYHWQHEPCWYAVRKGATGHWNGDRTQSTLWQIDKPQKSETGHSTQKPVECMLRPIENNSSIGQTVFDPFLGSGTTVIACEQSGRACIGIEISPAYVDVCVQRWEQFTGKTASLAES